MKHYCSFSEAIRAANGVLPQSFYGPGARDILSVDKGKVCALEGGLHIMGLGPFDVGSDAIYRESRRRYSYLDTLSDCPRPDCAEFEDGQQPLIDLIWHLNDDHHWSFGQIADWLEKRRRETWLRHDLGRSRTI